MKRLLLVSVLTVGFGSSCAPDPGKMCDHYMAVFANDPEKPAWSEDDDKCIERMENIKSRWGVNSYRREVECALSSNTAYKIRMCIEGEELHFRKKVL